ncbi:MAG: glycosyltransferase family protein, partial [Marinilabilia sp.]
PGIRLCIGNLCAPFSSSQIEEFKVFDFFTVCSPFFKQQLAKYGMKSVIIPHAFDRRVLEKTEENNNYPRVPFIFIGSVFADEGFHSLRLRVLEQLANDDIPFALYGNLPDRSLKGLFKRRASFLAARTLDSIGLKQITDRITPIRKGRNHDKIPRRLNISKKLYQKVMPPVFGIDMYKALSHADIGFNIHIDCAGDYAANMRMFETTGVGACLVTDYKSNLDDLFRIGTEVIAYKGAEDCIEKIKWLIDHPDKCQEIAENGQRRTLKSHTFEARVQVFYDFLIEAIRNQTNDKSQNTNLK